MHRALISLLFTVLLVYCYGQSTITLRSSFIDSFKNRVTIEADYDVWYTHHRAKSAAEDGDIHFSGYDKKIGLPTVGEIMNAINEQDAIDVIIDHEGKGKTNNLKMNIVGVWRLWPEHMGSGARFFQGMKLTKAKIQEKTTNPDHVFEIHPITKIEDIDVVGSIHNIEGYDAKNARTAINQFKAKNFSISSAKKTISFKTSQIGNNYIDMWIRIDSLWDVDDGSFAYCRILDSDFDLDNDDVEQKTVSNKIRIVFVKDSEVYNAVHQAAIGDFLHILGTPRINLAVLSWREWVSGDRPEVLTWKLPFEFIADGIIQ